MNSIPQPSNDALYRQVAALPGVELLVAYTALAEPHRLWTLDIGRGYACTVMRGYTFGDRAHLNPGVGALVRRYAPDVAVLSGSYAMPTMHLAAWALHRRRVPWVYWGEELQTEPIGPVRTVLRDTLRRTIRSAYGVLAIGSRACRSYEHIGVPRSRVADFRYYAENAHFDLARGAREAARGAIRAQLGITADAPVFLYCGQLIERKRVDTLLRAHALLGASHPGAVVVLAGAGPDREALLALSRELGTAAKVRDAGFVDYAALPRCFAAADALVLPSRQEGWGMVVPEALAAGLPVLASDRVNAAADLVRNGETGWIFPVGDWGELATQMRTFCDLADRAPMAARACETAEREDPRHAAPRMVALLEAVLAGRALAAPPDAQFVAAVR